jgi:hypothetical protein
VRVEQEPAEVVERCLDVGRTEVDDLHRGER